MKTKPTFREEKKLWKKGYEFVIGADEVGRGSFAGPVTIGAVIFEDKAKPCVECKLGEINDSKLLSHGKRVLLSKEIKKHALFWNIATVGVSIINKKGIGKATKMAFRKAIKSIMYKKNSPYFLLVDGFHIKYLRGIGLKNQKAIIKGDRKSISIAAASIIAKVYRDNLMKKLHKKFPVYSFAENKGYGTKKHQLAIKKYGLILAHRTSFALQNLWLPDNSPLHNPKKPFS